MKRLIATCILLTLSGQSWGLGAYPGIPARGLFNTTSSVNQFSQTSSDPGDQQRQWNQEEEDLNTTDEQKYELIKQEERKKQEEQERQDQFIDSHRYDEPGGKIYNEE